MFVHGVRNFKRLPNITRKLIFSQDTAASEKFRLPNFKDNKARVCECKQIHKKMKISMILAALKSLAIMKVASNLYFNFIMLRVASPA